MAALLAFAAPPAAASTPPPLLITITPVTTSTGNATPLISALLTCDPAGGTHPYAAQACADIAAVNGNIAAIAPLPGMGCIALWSPVKISIQGIWRGRMISFSETQSNIGCARISHRYVFYL